MRIFMTGASGYIGRVVAEHALGQGHAVIGLARNAQTADRLVKAGVTPLEGSLLSGELLTKAASEADGVIHLGIDYGVGSFEEIMSSDKAAVRALAAGLAGTGKGLITTSGTGVAAPAADGGETNEDAPLWENPILRLRGEAEADARSLAADGVRVAAIRLPPFVYGRGGSSFVPALLKAAIKNDFAPYIGTGTLLTSAVDVDEAAKLYLLALEKASAGVAFNATTERDIPLRALAETIGAATGVPARSLPRAEVEALLGPFITIFLDTSSRPSSERAVRQLGWRPAPTLSLLRDISHGSYGEAISQFKRDVTSSHS
ncbi:3-beta hydroxysteroid dehydrogenase [Burkholderia sp. WAC0059]|uniref:NAD-dependent epimerase/dehydratase family protein n=1 Tax=Burkholderia sp. WAC0059 TaxID=2066022 RepID=UPI000C7F5A21|nr:NAD-dependent epimerase/dehydratase family protein [Burkholderia sp. WAC0059]PLZ00957.1 3-beta hydroxysteroid dehydrogenase [Burkholderia sp. WAC0059]